MPNQINYKLKYTELRSKYMNDVDTAFRLGYEQGQQEASQQQALDAEAQAHEVDMANAGGMAPGQGAPGEEVPGQQPGQEAPEQIPGQEAQGSELDQHINKLESMIGSTAPGASEEIQKSLNAILSLRKSEKAASEMKKSEQAIKGISKALHTPKLKIGVQAQSNLNESAKKAVTMQHKIVSDIMNKWKSEETSATTSIEKILNIELPPKE